MAMHFSFEVKIDDGQRFVGLESFGQILRPFVANFIIFKLMVVNVLLDLSPSAKYFAPSSPILLLSKLMVVNVLLDLSPSAKYFAPSSPI